MGPPCSSSRSEIVLIGNLRGGALRSEWPGRPGELRHGPVSGGRASVVLDGVQKQGGLSGRGAGAFRNKEACPSAPSPALGIASLWNVGPGGNLASRNQAPPSTSALCSFVPPTCLGASPCMKEACERAQGDGGTVVLLACPACRMRPAPGQLGCDLRGPGNLLTH